MPIPEKLYIQIVKRRKMPVDFRLEEMREIPGCASTSMYEYEERMIEVRVPRLEDITQLPAYMDLIIRAVRREHRDVVTCLFCEPFMETRESDPVTVHALAEAERSTRQKRRKEDNV